MVAATQSYKTPAPTRSQPAGAVKYVSWEQFQRRYLAREDGYTYEWTNGKVEKTKGTMDISQAYIWNNLDIFFRQLHPAPAGKLITEIDILLNPEKHRRPDIAYFTLKQLQGGIKNPVQIPSFVIEIISPNDRATKVSRKVQEYFQAGVKVVWNIYPALGEVHVFESATAAQICMGDARCSAEAALPGFVLPVSEILAGDAPAV